MSETGGIPTATEAFGRWEGITSLIISLITFFIALGFGLEVAISITLGVIFGAAAISSMYVNARYGLHSKVIERVRRQILFSLTSIVINSWDIGIKMNENGGAKIVHNISGKVNFGLNRWLPLRIETDPQSKQLDMNMKATNCEKAQDLRVEEKLNTPAYKAFHIHFDHVLRRPDRFRICVEYDVIDTFFFDVEDWYNHRANHYEKTITLSVEFPKNIEVINVWQSVTTEHGDVWQDIEPAQLPTPQKIFWRIGKAYYGNQHHLSWTTRKIKFAGSKT